MTVKVRIKKRLGAFALDVEFEGGNEVLALLGGSGCGKSMTLRCIAGIVTPDEGHIEVNGVVYFDSKKRVNMKPQQRRSGLLFQNYALFPNMTTKQNIMTVFEHGAGGAAAKDERYAEIARKFYLTGLDDHYPRQLSGGQQQRAALARIMASGPSLIMLDEPLSALDSFLRWKLEIRLSRLLREFSGTTLFVSHNRDEVYRLCDKVCVINEGRSEQVRCVKEFFERPTTIASAILSGCKNYSRVEPRADGLLRALDWGADFRYNGAAPQETRYIGVRAHNFVIEHGHEYGLNIIRGEISEIHEDLFSAVINVTPSREGGNDVYSVIRAETAKNIAAQFREGESVSLSAPEHAVMPLLG